MTRRGARFAVSAYGRHVAGRDGDGKLITNADRPTGFPLPAFGLEVPFLWACRESDASARETLAARATRLDGRRFWRLRESLRTHADARELASRSTPDREVHSEALGVRRHARQVAVRQLLICVGLVAALVLGPWLGFEATRDAQARTGALAALDDATTTDTEFDAACDWLGRYSSSGWYRHRISKLTVPATEAEDRRGRAITERADRLWDQVSAANDSGVKLIRLRGYPAAAASGAT